jgi:hypothetical protein
MNNESERLWKEVIVDKLTALSQHLPGETAGNHKNFRHYNWSPVKDLSSGPPKYE